MLSRKWLLVSDFLMSFMWVWASVLIKIFVYQFLGFKGHDLNGEILKHSLAVVSMFFFAYLVKLTQGAAYNPLTVLSAAISGDFRQFLFTVGARIPAQVTPPLHIFLSKRQINIRLAQIFINHFGL